MVYQVIDDCKWPWWPVLCVCFKCLGVFYSPSFFLSLYLSLSLPWLALTSLPTIAASYSSTTQIAVNETTRLLIYSIPFCCRVRVIGHQQTDKKRRILFHSVRSILNKYYILKLCVVCYWIFSTWTVATHFLFIYTDTPFFYYQQTIESVCVCVLYYRHWNRWSNRNACTQSNSNSMLCVARWGEKERTKKMTHRK